MLNILKSEIMKSKGYNIFRVCFGIVVITLVLFIAKGLNGPAQIIYNITMEEWARSTIHICMLLIVPIVNGILFTFVIQREYGEHTIINVLNAPISRMEFVTGKFLLCAAWQLFSVTICYILTVFGCWLRYPETFSLAYTVYLASMIYLGGLFSFLANLPVIAICFLQRKSFYISFLFCLLFAGITSLALQMPPKLSALLPWSGVIYMHYCESLNIYSVISISICGLASLIVSFLTMQKQEL